MDERYQVDNFLGRGGMCSVFRGVHKQLGKPVALKVLHESLLVDPDAVQRFRREAAAVGKLNHPNIVSASGFGVVDGKPFIALEFIQGESLAERMKRDGAFGAGDERFLEIAVQVCAAVQHAHENGVIHRDLKPSNVMLLGEGVVKVVDFGIAKILPESDVEMQKLTQTGEIFGTLPYMSPEQCRGEKLTAASDVYSFGCMVYEMLTGKPPFASENPYSLIQKHVAAQPVADVRLGKYAGLVMQCLRKEPAERPQNMEAVREKLLAPDAVPIESAKPRKFLLPGLQNVGWVVASIALVAAIGMVGVALAAEYEKNEVRSEHEQAIRLTAEADAQLTGKVPPPEARNAYRLASEAMRRYVQHAHRMPPNTVLQKQIYDAEGKIGAAARKLGDDSERRFWLKSQYDDYRAEMSAQPLLLYGSELMNDTANMPSQNPLLLPIFERVHENIQTLNAEDAARARSALSRLYSEKKDPRAELIIKEKIKANDAAVQLQEALRDYEEKNYDFANSDAQEAALSATYQKDDYAWCQAKTLAAKCLAKKGKYGESHDRAEEAQNMLESMHRQSDPLYQEVSKVAAEDDVILKRRNIMF